MNNIETKIKCLWKTVQENREQIYGNYIPGFEDCKQCTGYDKSKDCYINYKNINKYKE